MSMYESNDDNMFSEKEYVGGKDTTQESYKQWEVEFDDKWSSWIIDYLSQKADDDVLQATGDKEEIKEEIKIKYLLIIIIRKSNKKLNF